MDYNIVINEILQNLAFVVSCISCFYTYKTFKQSHKISNTIDDERRFNWNRKELKYLFRSLPIESIDSFFDNPNYIRNDLWLGFRDVDLDTFQFDGDEKAIVTNFVQRLDEFKNLRYEQIPSRHWKFQPLSDQEPFDAEKEKQEISKIINKANDLKPLYNNVKNLLLKYHINIRDINANARAFYEMKLEEEQTL